MDKEERVAPSVNTIHEPLQNERMSFTKKDHFKKESSSSQPLILSRFVSFQGSDRGLTSIYSHMYYTVGGSEIW